MTKLPISRFVCVALAAAVSIFAFSADEVSAQQNAPAVAVPQVPTPAPTPGPVGIAGCWAANQLIYGPYSFSFCSNGAYGNYQVSGGGLSCSGTINVGGQGGQFRIQLGHGRCNGNTDWSADYLICTPIGGFGAPAAPGTAAPQVAVPQVPTPGPGVGGLNCTYYPVAPGYSPIGVSLRRT
jgi:hypothetical protein